MNRTQTRRAFGLPTDPWRQIHIDTADTGIVADMIDAAIGSRDGYDQAMIQIVGTTGAGKSTAVWRALRAQAINPETDLIQVQRLDRDSRTIADVVSAIYRTLGVPRPTRAEDRDARLREVLGRAVSERRDARRRKLLLILDDAHHLHWRTISALKGLRELAWLGRAPLIGVILLSQRDVLSARAEIRERSDTYTLAGPSRADAETALDQVLGERIAADARGLLAARACAWNSLIWHTDQAMTAAIEAGRRQIERIDVHRAIGTSPDDLAQLIADSGRSLADLAAATGASKGHISRVKSGQRQDAALAQKLADILLSDQAAGQHGTARGAA